VSRLTELALGLGGGALIGVLFRFAANQSVVGSALAGLAFAVMWSATGAILRRRRGA
jgi:hypothetical protein